MHGLHIGMLLLDAWTDAWISQQNRPGQGRTINIIIQQSSSERAQYTYYIVKYDYTVKYDSLLPFSFESTRF